jgi:hypothetical protein
LCPGQSPCLECCWWWAAVFLLPEGSDPALQRKCRGLEQGRGIGGTQGSGGGWSPIHGLECHSLLTPGSQGRSRIQGGLNLLLVSAELSIACSF